jgi:hypothetical protein
MASSREIVAAQLTALRAGEAKRWRAFRRTEVVCGVHGCVLLEIMGTSPISVVFRQVENPVAAAEQRLGRMKVRTGLPNFWLEDELPELLGTTCVHQSPVFLREDVTAWISGGTRKVTIRPDHVSYPDTDGTDRLTCRSQAAETADARNL